MSKSEIILPKALQHANVREDIAFAHENGFELLWLYWLIEDIELSLEQVDKYFEDLQRKKSTKFIQPLFSIY